MVPKARLKDYLENNHVKYASMLHPKVYTAQEMAHILHISGKMFAKTVILNSHGKYLMAVLPATHKVNIEQFKKLAHVDEAKLTSEYDMMKQFPYCEAGGMSPFGNLYEMPTYVDSSLAEDKEIFFNANSLYEAIKMKYEDYEELVHPVIGDFASHC